MGLFDFILGLFGWRPEPHSQPDKKSGGRSPASAPKLQSLSRKKFRGRRAGKYVRLAPLRRAGQLPPRTQLNDIAVPELPYPFARMGVLGGYLDLSRDGDQERLAQLGLPDFQNPAQLAEWIGISVGKLAWLVHRCEEGQRPQDPRSAHYHFRWLKKRKGGYRLIEAPKTLLKTVQQKILRGGQL
jgi:RNA-directed DNA polymerase